MLGDWFATALFWKPQVALVMNARTYLPVFLPLAPAGKLLERIPTQIAQILTLHGVDPATIDAELEQMADARIAPTNDRSVVGVMNEFAFLGGHFFEGDLTDLSMRMASTPVGPLRSSHGFPDRALAALLADRATGSERAEHTATIIPFRGRSTAASDTKAEPPTTQQPDSSGSVFQLEVRLLDTEPPVWRRILVDGSITLDRLHEVIQAAFGWWNYHLHEFEIGDTRYGVPDPDWDAGPPTVDERTVRLDAVARAGVSFLYTYDFGDDWRHEVTVEQVTPADTAMRVPDCIDGGRACPPGGLRRPVGLPGPARVTPQPPQSHRRPARLRRRRLRPGSVRSE